MTDSEFLVLMAGKFSEAGMVGFSRNGGSWCRTKLSLHQREILKEVLIDAALLGAARVLAHQEHLTMITGGRHG